jgi:hypothetical protein
VTLISHGVSECQATSSSMTAKATPTSDLFIIQFLPIYLADFASAWLDHLPRDVIHSWDVLREIFTSNI